MFETGYFRIGSWKGVPIRIHWTALLGAVLFGGIRFAPGAWVGFFAILVLHELGHAWLVRRRGHRATDVRILFFGGECRYTGNVTALDRSIIAWGGVLAQALVLAGALATESLWPPRSVFVADLYRALIVANGLIIALNLLPVQPLDGHQAWKLFGLLKRRRERGDTSGGRESRSGRRPRVVRRSAQRTDEEAPGRTPQALQQDPPRGRDRSKDKPRKRKGDAKKSERNPRELSQEAQRLAREALERARERGEED